MWPEEFSPDVEFDQYSDWQWWIASSELSRKRQDILEEYWLNGLSDEDLGEMLNSEGHMYYLPEAQEFTEAGPVTMINAFCQCHIRGVYPPPWIMNDLYQKFNQYLLEKLHGSDKLLDEIFAGKGKGLSRPIFKQAALAPVWEKVMHDIHRFRIWFGLSIKNATAIVIQYPRLSMGEDQGFATAEKKYKEFNKHEPFERHKIWYSKHPPLREFKVRMVRNYPKEAFLPHWPIFREYWED